jgi:hypothetical protein
MSDIFISYAREDRQPAEALAAAFTSLGWSVWWDTTIRAGMTFDKVINAELANTRCVIVLWSNVSVKSDWVRAEAYEGSTREILVPVIIESGVNIPLPFGLIQTADLVHWNGAAAASAFQVLAGDVSHLLGPPPILEAQRKAEAEAKRKVDEPGTLRRRAGDAVNPDAGEKKQSTLDVPANPPTTKPAVPKRQGKPKGATSPPANKPTEPSPTNGPTKAKTDVAEWRIASQGAVFSKTGAQQSKAKSNPGGKPQPSRKLGTPYKAPFATGFRHEAGNRAIWITGAVVLVIVVLLAIGVPMMSPAKEDHGSAPSVPAVAPADTLSAVRDLVDDDFRSKRVLWTGTEANGLCRADYADSGGYVIENRQRSEICPIWHQKPSNASGHYYPGVELGLWPRGELGGRLRIEVTLTKLGGHTPSDASLRFGSWDNLYAFVIGDDGLYHIDRYRAKEGWTEIREDTTAAIRKGENVANRLTLDVHGRNVTSHINGEQVNSINVDKEITGGVGFTVNVARLADWIDFHYPFSDRPFTNSNGPPLRVRFDHLHVSVLP